MVLGLGLAWGSPGRLSLWQVNYCTVLLASVADRLPLGSAHHSKCLGGRGTAPLPGGTCPGLRWPWAAPPLRCREALWPSP